MHKGPMELKAAIIAYSVLAVIGIVFWALVIWGLFEVVTLLSHLNESK